MSRRTHLLFAGLVLYWYIQLMGLQLKVEWMVSCLTASFFSDLDYYLHRLPLIEHRKTLHNLWALVITSIPLISYKIWLPWALGYATHLFLDSTTRAGVDILLVGKRIRGPLRTGGLFDRILFFLMLSYAAFLITRNLTGIKFYL